MPGRNASLLLGAAATASLGAAAIYALTASNGIKQSSFSDFLSSSGILKAGNEQPVAVSSAANTAQPHYQVTSAAATAGNGAVDEPAASSQQAVGVPQPAESNEHFQPAPSTSRAISTQAEEAATTACDTDLQTSSAGQQLISKPQRPTSHAEVHQPPLPCEDGSRPVQLPQGHCKEQQSSRAQSPAQTVLNPAQQMLQQPSDQQEDQHQQQDASALEQQLQCAEQPQQQDIEERSEELQQTQDACELDGELDERPQQQITATAAPPTPRQLQHLQPPPAAALGPPSERDKAIMYRLSIDKSAWHDSHSNSGRSSLAGDTDELGRLLAESANHAAESSAIAVAGSSGGAASVIAAFERSISISRQASTSSPASPRSTTTSPKFSGFGKQRQVLNTTRCQPSLNTTVSTAAVACSLAVQYANNSSRQGSKSRQVGNAEASVLSWQLCSGCSHENWAWNLLWQLIRKGC